MKKSFNTKKFTLVIITLVVVILLALIIKQVIYKRSINTPVSELQSMQYETDPSEFVKDYIKAINKGDLNKVGYMNGASIGNIKQNFIVVIFQDNREAFPNITDISVSDSDELAPTVTVYWKEKVNDLAYTNFKLTWNDQIEMWNVDSYGF